MDEVLHRLYSAIRRRGRASKPVAASPFPGQSPGPSPATILERARAAHAAGRLPEAGMLCKRVLELEFDNIDGAHSLWADAERPGDNYLQVLDRIHKHLRPRAYIEIGVKAGESLALVAPGTAIVGIDPQPQLAPGAFRGAKIFSETSDEFFAGHDPFAELGGVVDLAFIDGMHLFEFALRDFINLERYCAPASTILVHDCYPLDERTAHRARVTSFWSGDVWKLIVCLKRYRPDLAIHTLAAAPTGLAMIGKLDPTSTVLRDNLERIYEEYVSLPYSVLQADKQGLLNVTSSDWQTVSALLAAHHLAG